MDDAEQAVICAFVRQGCPNVPTVITFRDYTFILEEIEQTSSKRIQVVGHTGITEGEVHGNMAKASGDP